MCLHTFNITLKMLPKEERLGICCMFVPFACALKGDQLLRRRSALACHGT